MLTNFLADIMYFSFAYNGHPLYLLNIHSFVGWSYFKIWGLTGKIQAVNLHGISKLKE